MATLKTKEKYLTFDDILICPEIDTEINSRNNVDISTKFSRNIKLDIPFASSPMDSVSEYRTCNAMTENGGIGILHRFFYIEKEFSYNKYKSELKFCVANGRFAIAVGLEDKEKLIEFAGNNNYLPSAVVLDIAHGGMRRALDFLSHLVANKLWNYDIIAANVATYEQAKIVASLGVDGIRIGLGNGASCTTRLVAGVGVPMFSSIIECRQAIDEVDPEISLICDGGVMKSADCVKAIAAGADCILSGRLFADTFETPGWKHYTDYHNSKNETWEKEYKGMARFGDKTPEGAIIPIIKHEKPISVKDRLKELCDGIRSACSYVGAHNLKELYEKAEYIIISDHSHIENGIRRF